VADLVGLHENSVRFHLDRLVEEGAATREAERRAGGGRPRHT
jgi:predicted ArsR family transcriptional regulator